jgi:hypothetical protein
MAGSVPESREDDVRTRIGEDVIRNEGVIVIVDLPDRPSAQPARVWSPRLANPQHAAFFAKQMMPGEWGPDSSQSTS